MMLLSLSSWRNKAMVLKKLQVVLLSGVAGIAIAAVAHAASGDVGPPAPISTFSVETGDPLARTDGFEGLITLAASHTDDAAQHRQAGPSFVGHDAFQGDLKIFE